MLSLSLSCVQDFALHDVFVFLRREKMVQLFEEHLTSRGLSVLTPSRVLAFWFPAGPLTPLVCCAISRHFFFLAGAGRFPRQRGGVS